MNLISSCLRCIAMANGSLCRIRHSCTPNGPTSLSSASITAFHFRRGIAVIVTALLLSLTSLGRAQSLPGPGPQLRASVIREAHAAFSSGDSVTGLAKLASNIKQSSRAGHSDLQFARQLVHVCFLFKNERNGSKASELAALALSRVQAPEDRMGATDAAAAWALAAQIQEYVVGNVAEAKNSYQRSLALAPNQRLVRERLARLQSVETNTAEKAAANLLLRQRALDEKTSTR